MSKTILRLTLLTLAVAFIYSCIKSDAKDNVRPRLKNFGNTTESGYDSLGRFVGKSAFISVDEANRMISSYLHSINYPFENSAIRAWTINGDALRQILSDSTVKSVKFMLGHSMGYILSGKEGQIPDSSSRALTLIAVGLDTSGNYKTTSDEVLDNSMPCPEVCPPGTGGHATITKL